MLPSFTGAALIGLIAILSSPACAQLINNINALFAAHEDRFFATPNFHVFAMYAAHQNGKALRTVFSAPSIAFARDGRPQALWGLAGSASLHDKELIVTVVNPHATEARRR